MFFPYIYNFQHKAYMEMEQCTYKYIYQISLDNFSQFVYGTHPCAYFHCARSAFSNFMVINQTVHNAYQRSARLSSNNNSYSRSDFCALNSPRSLFFTFIHFALAADFIFGNEPKFVCHLAVYLFIIVNYFTFECFYWVNRFRFRAGRTLFFLGRMLSEF